MTKVPDLKLPSQPRHTNERPRPIRQTTMFNVPSMEDAYTSGAGPVIVKRRPGHATVERMKHLIVQSVDGTFYNLIKLDDDNNQEIVATSKDLGELQAKQSDAPVIKESEIADHHHPASA